MSKVVGCMWVSKACSVGVGVEGLQGVGVGVKGL